MQFTANLSLKKPDGTDNVNIADLNENTDKLDVEITKKATQTQDGRMSKEDKTKLDGIALATQAEAEAGTSSSKYMTPQRTAQAIQKLAPTPDLSGLATKTEVNAHLADKTNPHNVTKAQVGLGNVQNYGIATDEEAIAGEVDNKLMTPAKVKKFAIGFGDGSYNLYDYGSTDKATFGKGYASTGTSVTTNTGRLVLNTSKGYDTFLTVNVVAVTDTLIDVTEFNYLSLRDIILQNNLTYPTGGDIKLSIGLSTSKTTSNIEVATAVLNVDRSPISTSGGPTSMGIPDMKLNISQLTGAYYIKIKDENSTYRGSGTGYGHNMDIKIGKVFLSYN